MTKLFRCLFSLVALVSACLPALGATNEPKFTDETAAMMRFSDAINVMLPATVGKPAGAGPTAGEGLPGAPVRVRFRADGGPLRGRGDGRGCRILLLGGRRETIAPGRRRSSRCPR